MCCFFEDVFIIISINKQFENMLENNAKLLAIQSELKPYRLGH